MKRRAGSAFGASFPALKMDISTLSAQMDEVVASLRSALTQAQTQVGMVQTENSWDVFGLLGNSNGPDAGAKNLSDDGARIDTLDRDYRQRVLSGDMAPTDWQSRAQTIADDIRAQSGIVVSSNGLSALWTGVVSQSVSDIAGDIKDAIPSTLEFNFVVVAGVAALILVLFIKMS